MSVFLLGNSIRMCYAVTQVIELLWPRLNKKTKALRPSPEGFVQAESILGRMGILGGIPVLLPAI